MIKDLKKRVFTSLGLLLILIFIAKIDFLLLFFLIVFGLFSIIEFFNIIKKITKNNFLKFIQNSLFVLFIFFYCYLFFFFSNIPQLKIILFILLLGCIASDIGGLTFGRIFKGPKLTIISPKKTISGSLGSILFSILIINILFFYFINSFNIKIFTVSIITSIGSQLGDLFFSYLKRKAKIKDTGNILPGHGGVLDRLDGIFLGIPSGFIAFTFLY
tara:strand:- start:318 stop:965 length:648 start_codon:yes stop_codon:yes gene_type:complete